VSALMQAILFWISCRIVVHAIVRGVKRMFTPKTSPDGCVMLPCFRLVLNDVGLHDSTAIRVWSPVVFGGGMSWCVVPFFLKRVHGSL